MKALFLDIDGVLNGHEKHPDSPYTTIRPDCVQRLNQVLKATGCQLVISSAWRYMMLRIKNKPAQMSLKGFQYMLHTHGLVFHDNNSSVYGHTMADEVCCYCDCKTMSVTETGSLQCFLCSTVQTRGKQITAWVKANKAGFKPLTSYAVVDDDDFGIRAEKHPFVQTDGKLGLMNNDVKKLIRLLGKKS